MMQRNKPPKLEIGVLYGFRALMVLFVANYHLWQQSWIPQHVSVLGKTISLDFWTRSSYLFVDGMILLSGFLLYLPYAAKHTHGTQVPSVKRFYFNRASRILPSYVFAVFAMLLCVAVPQNLYHSSADLWKDLLSHLSFTFLFSYKTYVATPLNVALWTIAVEVQFYLIFPLLARSMRRRPALTAGVMMLAAWLYRFLVAQLAKDTNILINQLPAFLDVYALGMLGAMGWCRFDRWLQKAAKEVRRMAGTFSVVLFAAGANALVTILKVQSAAGSAGHEALRLSQMAVRLPLAITLGSMMFSAAFWPRFLQKLLNNRLMRFLSVISMNLYIWHQVLAVQMRMAWFPDIDLLHTDKNLQSAYMLLCAAVALLAAMAVTFGLEQPATRWLNKRFAPK